LFGLYLLFSYVATVAWGLAKKFGVLRRPGAAADLDAHGRAPVGEAVVTVLALNSIIGISPAVNITIGKVLLDQARMAAVPRQLVRVHLVHRTPVTGADHDDDRAARHGLCGRHGLGSSSVVSLSASLLPAPGPLCPSPSSRWAHLLTRWARS